MQITEYANGEFDVHFDEPLRIANRPDALGLLDVLLTVETVKDLDVPLKALIDAIERETV
ncbi:MAG: hypothetical protein LBH43_12850 [Treponema sp.]|jgi:hypothetical protein|nr:hypothetical protein [Treponema sp.]